MTIVATEDTRNSAWAENKAGFGHKMLAKMGWKEGRGLGKNQQGTTNNLRAIRREDSLGIGASTDTHGAEGWSATSANFHGVLAKLTAEHGASTGDVVLRDDPTLHERLRCELRGSAEVCAATLFEHRPLSLRPVGLGDFGEAPVVDAIFVIHYSQATSRK